MSVTVSRTITKATKPAVLHAEIVAQITDFEGLRQDGTEYEFDFATSPNETTLDTVIANHSGDITPKEAIIQVYIQREIDGVAFFRSARADLALMYQAGDITIADAVEIEQKLNEVKWYLISGDWASAQYEMANNVTVSGALTQEIYDDIKNPIDDYVTANYS
jgi:hypothetical protein